MESGTFARASSFGAKRVWFPVLMEDSSEANEELKETSKSARVVRLLFLKVSRRPVIYDDWASADVASAETRRVLANMAVAVRLWKWQKVGGRSTSG